MRVYLVLGFVLFNICGLLCNEDPDKLQRTNVKEMYPLKQEIIKLMLKRYGIEYFEARYRAAEQRANQYNVHLEWYSYVIPSCEGELFFYPEDADTDPLTKALCVAVANKARTKEGYERRGVLPGALRYKIQEDGSIRCRTRITGLPSTWAKKYI